jgi:predicted O-linked N-acetylglucosamine transferase (SPINDLY family)
MPRIAPTTLALAVALAAGAAWAEGSPPSPRQACMASARTLCPSEFASFDAHAVKLCLLKNLDKASPDCREAVKAAQARQQGATAPAQGR